MHSKKGLMKVAAITGLALVMTTGIAMASIGTGTVTADALRLRSQANTNSNILTLAPHNSVVTLLEELDGWYKVSYGDQVGYMSADWLDVTLTGSEAVVGQCTVTADALHVRSGPGTGYASKGLVYKGTALIIQKDCGNGWYQISGGGLTGFMSTSYLSGTGSTVGSNTGSGGSTSYTVAYVNNPRSTQVLNLREMPSQSSRSIGQYRNGTQVKVVSYGNTWCEVYVGTRHGYMMTQYLSFNGNYLPPSYPSAPSYPTVTATPPLITYITPKPQQPTPEPPAAGTTISLAPSAVGGGSAINVYNDASLTSLKATYSNGTRATMLTYGENVCMILIDGGVAYVSTWNVNY